MRHANFNLFFLSSFVYCSNGCTIEIVIMISALNDAPCVLRDYGQGNKVCVCNATFCDTIYRVPKIKHGEFVSYVSSKEGLRFFKSNGKLSQTKDDSRSSEFSFNTSKFGK